MVEILSNPAVVDSFDNNNSNNRNQTYIHVKALILSFLNHSILDSQYVNDRKANGYREWREHQNIFYGIHISRKLVHFRQRTPPVNLFDILSSLERQLLSRAQFFSLENYS